VFARAGCKTPRSVVIRFGATNDSPKKKLVAAAAALRERGCHWPLLIKPNSGGFGNGIKLFMSMEDLVAYSDTLSRNELGPSEDGVALLQEYIEPRDKAIYRVWFVNGRPQCAVQRFVEGVVVAPDSSGVVRDDDFTSGCAAGGSSSNTCSLTQHGKGGSVTDRTRGSEGAVNDFTSGCASNGCRLERRDQDKKRRSFRAWSVPENVSNDISRIVSIVGDDCDAGSVEFLYDENGNQVYFDLNMLSTLPITDNGSVENSEAVWHDVSYDPWSELADAVIEKLKC